MEVEGIVKGRLCFTIMDREGLHIARLGSADLNFAQLWIKVRPLLKLSMPYTTINPGQTSQAWRTAVS